MIAAAAASTGEFTGAVPANIAFGIVATMMIVAAIRVVTTKNVVHAALYLVVVLAGVGINYLLLQAEFVAITQFLVYIGAVIVLFLFGIMLTRAPMQPKDSLDNDLRWPGLVAGLFFFGILAALFVSTFEDDKINLVAPVRTSEVTSQIFTNYIIPFEVIGVLLLGALIGAVVLARKD